MTDGDGRERREGAMIITLYRFIDVIFMNIVIMTVMTMPWKLWLMIKSTYNIIINDMSIVIMPLWTSYDSNDNINRWTARWTLKDRIRPPFVIPWTARDLNVEEPLVISWDTGNIIGNTLRISLQIVTGHFIWYYLIPLLYGTYSCFYLFFYLFVTHDVSGNHIW